MTTALVLEGGSSRVAYTNGVCAALQAARFAPDAVYGTSAGGAMAAWFATGQAEAATRYWDLIRDPEVLSLPRALIGRPAYDLDALYERHYPRLGLTKERIRAVPYPVVVTLANADTGATRHVDVRGADDPLRVIRCGAAIPILSKTPVPWDGGRWLDGGVTDPIPLQAAIDAGHRDIVLVLNGPDVERGPESAVSQRLVARRFPALRDALARRHAVHNATVRLAKAPPAGVHVRIVRPMEALGISRTSRDLRVIGRAIARGRADGEAALKAWASRAS